MKKLVAILIILLPFGFIQAQKVQNLCSSTAPVKYTISGTPGMQYHWSINSSDVKINYLTGLGDSVLITWPSKADTTHKLSVYGDLGSCSSNTKQLSVYVSDNPTLNLGPDANICQGQTKEFDISGSYKSIIWNNSLVSNKLVIDSTSKIWATVTDSLGCKATDTVYVKVNTLPKVILGPDVSICYGQSHTFGFDTINYKSVVWQDGSIGSHLTVDSALTVIVNVTNDAGCNASDTANVTMKPKVVVNLGKDSVDICDKDYIVLDAGNAGNKYLWSTSIKDTLQTLRVDSSWQNRLIKVIVWNKECSASDSIEIIACSVTFDKDKVPNAFTPNDDKFNDLWEIPGLNRNYPNAIVVVYDRWGRIVFQSPRGYPNPWDGRSKGVTLPVDNYFYIINLNVSGKKPIVGNVMIIR